MAITTTTTTSTTTNAAAAIDKLDADGHESNCSGFAKSAGKSIVLQYGRGFQDYDKRLWPISHGGRGRDGKLVWPIPNSNGLQEFYLLVAPKSVSSISISTSSVVSESILLLALSLSLSTNRPSKQANKHPFFYVYRRLHGS